MNGVIIAEFARLVGQMGQYNAIAEVLDSLESALGPFGTMNDEIIALRNRARELAAAEEGKKHGTSH